MKSVLQICSTGLCLAVSACLISGCQYEESTGNSGSSGQSSYVVQVAGSSTVAPVSEAVAEAYDNKTGKKVVVATTGTGSGMEKFSRKECDITGASRLIKQKEIDACKANGVEPIELKIGVDGISVVVSKENDWCKCLSTEQLKKLWEFNSKVKTWKDLDPSWPDKEIELFGPDEKSGTFDYFIEEIIGKDIPDGQSPCRTDYSQNVNDNVLVEGIKGSKYALGYFGYAYFVQNKDTLKAVGVSTKADHSDCVVPSDKAIEEGSYKPLSRPLFIYASKEALLTKPEVAEFVRYYLNEGQAQVSKVGYVGLPKDVVEATRKIVEDILKETAEENSSEDEGGEKQE